MDMVHGGIRHDAAQAVVGDQPLHYLRLTSGWGVEIDGVAAGMAGWAAAAGDHRPWAARGDDTHSPELRLDALEQAARGRRKAGARQATAGETDDATLGHRRWARHRRDATP